MKKTLFLGLVLVASAQMFGANGAQDLLKEARDNYYKNLNKVADKPVRESNGSEVRDLSNKDMQKALEDIRKEASTGNGTVEEYLKQKEKAPKPKTQMERLQYNSEKAADKVDFYERVVRSVRREEQEVSGYEDILGKKPSKKVDINKKSSKKPVKDIKK